MLDASVVACTCRRIIFAAKSSSGKLHAVTNMTGSARINPKSTAVAISSAEAGSNCAANTMGGLPVGMTHRKT